MIEGLRRLLVCGCARSGNTLLLHLLVTGFEETMLATDEGGERFPDDEPPPGRVLVGKVPKLVRELDELFATWSDLGVAITLRDPRDVLVSRHHEGFGRPWVPMRRWLEVAKEVVRWRDDPRTTIVRFEELVTEPARVQETLADRLGLSPAVPFDRCFEHFDLSDRTNMRAMKGARPLDPDRIGAWRRREGDARYLERLMRRRGEIAEWMERLGYEPESASG